MSKRRGLWGTRFGFYLAAIGSAFGLGNLWRFPYVAAENGGGAFVLLYTLLALVVGLPLLIGELMLGKLTRQSAVKAIDRLTHDSKMTSRVVPRTEPGRSRLWSWMGRASVFACVLVFSYYAVISGWVLHFFMQFIVGLSQGGEIDPETTLAVLRSNGLLQVALTSVHLLFTVIVVVKGVQEGIEKWVGNTMPIFVILLIVLVSKSLSLSSSGQALKFLFYPDFSKLTYGSLIHAVGHVMFTLSLGLGTMVTFGSYLTDHTHIPSAGFRVATLDTFISLFAGLLIFPLVISAPFDVSGPEVLFQALPRLFLRVDGGMLFGAAFFICLYLAALGASIGLLESIVSNWLDADPNRTRRSAAWMVGGVAFVLSIFPALSTTVFAQVNLNGRGLLEILDGFLINGILPVVALGLSLATTRRLRRELARTEFINDESQATMQLYSHWLFAIQWLAPLIIVISLALGIWGWIQSDRWPGPLW